MKGRMTICLFGMAAFLLLAISPAYASSNINRPIISNGMTYNVTLRLDGWSHYWHTYSDLASLTDRDKIVLTLPDACKVTVVVADCCLMGDTIGVYYPSTTLLYKAVSPGIIVGTSATFAAGTVITFYIGYVACPGGFPAGYDIWLFAGK